MDKKTKELFSYIDEYNKENKEKIKNLKKISLESKHYGKQHSTVLSRHMSKELVDKPLQYAISKQMTLENTGVEINPKTWKQNLEHSVRKTNKPA